VPDGPAVGEKNKGESPLALAMLVSSNRPIDHVNGVLNNYLDGAVLTFSICHYFIGVEYSLCLDRCVSWRHVVSSSIA
jgi:hypothetical protein